MRKGIRKLEGDALFASMSSCRRRRDLSLSRGGDNWLKIPGMNFLIQHQFVFEFWSVLKMIEELGPLKPPSKPDFIVVFNAAWPRSRQRYGFSILSYCCLLLDRREPTKLVSGHFDGCFYRK